MSTAPFDLQHFFKTYFTPACVSYGQDLFRQAGVSNLSFRSGHALNASVKAGAQVFRVNVLLEQLQHSKGNIVGTCTCPMGFNCRHVAAVLYKLEEDMDKALRKDEGFDKNRYKAWETWLDETQIRSKTGESAQNRSQDPVLVYIFSFGFYEDSPHWLFIDLYQSKPLKKGGVSLSAMAPAKLKNIDDLGVLELGDLHLLQQLHLSHVVNREDLGERYRLEPNTKASLIRDIINTGRAFWNEETRPLRWNESAETIYLAWHTQAQGGLKYLAHNTEEQPLILWPVSAPLSFNPKTQLVCPIITPLSENTLRQCISMPMFYPDQAQYLQTPFNAWAQAQGLPSLPLPKTQEEKIVSPKPSLTLYSTELSRILLARESRYRLDHPSTQYAYARLHFHYNGAYCAYNDYERNLYELNEEHLMIYPRQWTEEKRYLQQLNERELYPFEQKKPIEVKPAYRQDFYLGRTPEDIQFFLDVHQPELEALGWDIIYDPSFSYAPAPLYDEWYGELSETEKTDWFGLEMGVIIDDEKINLLPILANLLETQYAQQNLNTILSMDGNEPLELILKNNKKIAIPFHRFQTILTTLTELYDGQSFKDDRLILSKTLSSLLPDKDNIFKLPEIKWEMPQEIAGLSELWARFRADTNFPEPDKTFKGILRQYQLEGLHWLAFLRRNQFSGILADDMGLGKTIQALAHLALEKAHGRMKDPVLIVAPTSLIDNWQNEAAKFTPHFKTLILQGKNRTDDETLLQKQDLIITTYSVILHDEALLQKLSYYYVILDEAQWIKNANTKAFAVVTRLNSQHRLCLTGTPMENHLGELWSLFHFLNPGYLGSRKQFNKLFKNPIEVFSDEAQKISLQKRIAPFLLRRLKSVVAQDLPPKTEITQWVEMEEEQATLYESIRLSVGSKIKKILEKKGFAQSHIEILDALLKLRQACCDPRLVKLEAAQDLKQSAKLEMLMSMLSEMIEEGRKVLLFSSFTSMLSLIEIELQKESIPYVLLTGDTQDRKTPIAAFQNGEVPLFLLSLKAGGTGLNLTAADTVIHYDPWWNPAVENQATDRAHRIGQNKAVFIYKLITRGSVEEKIVHLQEKKKALLDDIFADPTTAGARLEVSDLNYLLAPMEELQ